MSWKSAERSCTGITKRERMSFCAIRDLWERMKRNGLFKIVFGLESPDPKQRERFGKRGYDLSSVESMMRTLEKELDIMVSVYLHLRCT